MSRRLACGLLVVGLAAPGAADPIRDEPGRAAPPAASRASKPVSGASPFSLLASDSVFTLSSGGDRRAPVTIKADVLEASESSEARTLRFERNVEVRQGEMLLRTDWLEAVYPRGAKQPARLRARGGVLLREGGREARCDRADYEQAAARITCEGDAVLKDGADEVRGESIVFDLEARRAIVRGGTRVAVVPREGTSTRSELLAGLERLGGHGAVTIDADEIQAWDTPEGRRVTFAGRVGVARDDVALEAAHIEAFYPPGASEPERLVASGEVRVTQGEREARCQRAEYRHGARQLECSGDARLRQADDRLSGDRIAFDLAAERLVVSGRSHLTLAPRERSEETP